MNVPSILKQVCVGVLLLHSKQVCLIANECPINFKTGVCWCIAVAFQTGVSNSQ